MNKVKTYLLTLAMLSTTLTSYAYYRDYTGQNLTGWDFSKIDGGSCEGDKFINATLTGAIFTDVIIKDANFEWVSTFTVAQLTSTASYKSYDLSGINFGSNTLLTGCDFSNQNLTNTSFDSAKLTGTKFDNAIITGANFSATTSNGFTEELLKTTASYNNDLSGVKFDRNVLSGWDFSNQNLTKARFEVATLVGTKFDNAIITGANFKDAIGFTKEQLYSTASYKNKDLREVWLIGNDLTGWNFSNQNLTGAFFLQATLTGADFTKANLTGTVFASARITGANFTNVIGFTEEQLYSTVSYYKDKDLSGVNFSMNDLSGWKFSGKNLEDAYFLLANLMKADFTGADLTNTDFINANLTGTKFDGAIITGANFTEVIGFTDTQLYNTASYNDKDLRRVFFSKNDLTGYDFSSQDLSYANFDSANLTEANFTKADLTNTDFTKATLTGADFTDAELMWNSFSATTDKGFTEAQLKSTASYKKQTLLGVSFWYNDLTGWDFTGQNLTNAFFNSTTLTNTDFRGATLTNTKFNDATIKNTIWNDGVIQNFSMTSQEDNFSIRKYEPISAKIDTSASDTGASITNSTLTLEAGAKVEVLKAERTYEEGVKAGLILGGNGAIEFEITNADSDTNLNIASDSSFDLKGGKFLINLVGDFTEEQYFSILTWNDGATISGLDTLVKGVNIILTLNGKDLGANWDMRLSDNALSVAVPEPSTYAAILGALALSAVAYRRRK